MLSKILNEMKKCKPEEKAKMFIKEIKKKGSITVQDVDGNVFTMDMDSFDSDDFSSVFVMGDDGEDFEVDICDLKIYK